MRKIFMFLLLTIASGTIYSQGIVFEHCKFHEALNKAKKENKIVFMDCYTTWCGPCKSLAKNVFVQKNVGDFFNKNFVSLKMDMESEEGAELKEKYKIKAFPTLLWINSKGQVQHKMVGGCDSDHLVKTAEIALDSKNNWKTMKLRYQKGERGLSFLYDYILTGSASYEDITDARKTYFSLKKDVDLINIKDARLIMSTIKLSSNPVFLFALNNKEKFDTVLGTNEMSEYLEKTMSFELIPLVLSKNKKGYSEKRNEILKNGKEIGKKVVACWDMNLLRYDADQEKYYEAMVNYALKYEFDNSKKLNQYASAISNTKTNLSKKIMTKALRIAKRAVKLNPNIENKASYASLLDKFGNS